MDSTEEIPQNNHPFDSIPHAIQDFKEGKILIVVDDEDRENEGDFIMAAEMITPEKINFMAKYGRGMICTPIYGETVRRAGVGINGSRQYRTAWDPVHCHYRCQTRHHYGHKRSRPSLDSPKDRRPGYSSQRLRPTRTHFSASCCGWWSA